MRVAKWGSSLAVRLPKALVEDIGLEIGDEVHVVAKAPGLDPIRPLSIETHEAAVDVAKQHGFSFYDSLIVASALEAKCDTLLTEDLQAGRSIQGVTIVNPPPRPRGSLG